MSATILPYRSATPVPERVDKAWHEGYDTGVREGFRWLGLVAVVEAVALARRHRLPWPVIVALVLTMGTVVVLVVGLTWCARQLLITWRRHPKVVLQRVDLGNGETF